MLGAKSGGYPAVAPLRKARNKIVVVNDRMQKGYRYELCCPGWARFSVRLSA